MREVARFESAGDVRVMRVGSQESGAVLLEEVVAGKSCFIAYGESSHTARMIFDVAALEGLAAMPWPPWQSLSVERRMPWLTSWTFAMRGACPTRTWGWEIPRAFITGR